MSRKQVNKSARLSSAARAALQRDTVVVVTAKGPTTRQAWLNAWNRGKIRWSEIPAEFRTEA